MRLLILALSTIALLLIFGGRSEATHEGIDSDGDSAGWAFPHDEADGAHLCDFTGLDPGHTVYRFINCMEDSIGTDGLDACADTATANDEAVDAFPPDLNDDQTVSVTDRTLMALKINQGTYDERYDFNQDGNVSVTDRTILILYFGNTCT